MEERKTRSNEQVFYYNPTMRLTSPNAIRLTLAITSYWSQLFQLHKELSIPIDKGAFREIKNLPVGRDPETGVSLLYKECTPLQAHLLEFNGYKRVEGKNENGRKTN